MSKKPYENTRLAKFIRQRVLKLQSTKSQSEIAAEAGFVNPNMISMIKGGSNKLPLDRVPSLARALDCDAAFLLGLALEQTVGETQAHVIVDVLGAPVSANELDWLTEIRKASGFSDPCLTADHRDAVQAMFGK